jgi:hypothetical protein
VFSGGGEAESNLESLKNQIKQMPPAGDWQVVEIGFGQTEKFVCNIFVKTFVYNWQKQSLIYLCGSSRPVIPDFFFI